MKKTDGLKPEYFITYNRPTELKREIKRNQDGTYMIL